MGFYALWWGEVNGGVNVHSVNFHYGLNHRCIEDVNCVTHGRSGRV